MGRPGGVSGAAGRGGRVLKPSRLCTNLQKIVKNLAWENDCKNLFGTLKTISHALLLAEARGGGFIDCPQRGEHRRPR